MGLPDVGIRDAVRTGDTPQAERERMRRTPPHILVTTPESLYILLTSPSGPRDAEVGEERDRRRAARRGRHQARRAPGAHARAARGAVRAPPGAHRPVGHREAARRDGALPHRRPGATTVDDHRRRPRARARPGDRGAAFAADRGDGQRGVGGAVRPAGRADRAAPHHADLRQPATRRRARARATWPSGSARSTSPRTTAAWRASTGSTPSSA